MEQNPLVQLAAGERRTFRFPVLDAENNNAPLDLTSFTARWVLAQRISGSDKLKTIVTKLSTTAGHMNITALTGIIDVELKRADTLTLLGDYVQQLWVIDAESESVKVSEGPVRISGAG